MKRRKRGPGRLLAIMLSAILTAGSMGFPVSADEYIPESSDAGFFEAAYEAAAASDTESPAQEGGRLPGDDASAGESAAETRPASVVFDASPETAVVAVYPVSREEIPEPEAIPAQEDGSYLLIPGEYVYTAGAEDYVSIENRPFTVTGDERQLMISFVLKTVADTAAGDVQSPEDIPEDAVGDATEDTAEDAAGDTTEDAAWDTTEDAAGDTTEDAAGDILEESAEDIVEDLPDPEDIPEDVAEDVADDIADPEDIPEDGKTVTAVLDDKTGNAAELLDSGYYVVTVPAIAAQNLDSPHTIRVSTGGGDSAAEEEFDMTLSALSYVNTILNPPAGSYPQAAKEAVTALYYYYMAAAAYTGVN